MRETLLPKGGGVFAFSEIQPDLHRLALVIGAVIDIRADLHRAASADRLVACLSAGHWKIAFQAGAFRTEAALRAPRTVAHDAPRAVRKLKGFADHRPGTGSIFFAARLLSRTVPR